MVWGGRLAGIKEPRIFNYSLFNSLELSTLGILCSKVFIFNFTVYRPIRDTDDG